MNKETLNQKQQETQIPTILQQITKVEQAGFDILENGE